MKIGLFENEEWPCSAMFIVAAYWKSPPSELLLWLFVKDWIESTETRKWQWRLLSHSLLPEKDILTFTGLGQLLEKPALDPHSLLQSNANWAWIKHEVPFVASNCYVIKLSKYLTCDNFRWWWWWWVFFLLFLPFIQKVLFWNISLVITPSGTLVNLKTFPEYSL